MSTAVYLGIDIGTSGIRGSVINSRADEIICHRLSFSSTLPVQGKNEQNPDLWLHLLDQLLHEIQRLLNNHKTDYRIAAIAIDGTSSTLIACNKAGMALSPALMYNDQQSQQEAQSISHFAPSESAVHSPSSSLAKALFLLKKYPKTEIFCHQADWLSSSLTGLYGISDENNCLKMGYDSINQQWPKWLHSNNQNAVLPKQLLPRVVAPGSCIAVVKPALIKKYNLAQDCMLVAGTTDSNAAVLATGASKIGDAVTSLGSTLVLKIFSKKPLFQPEYGIYSHRLYNRWLVGGASNSGGSVLLQHFNQIQLDEMTPLLKPEQPMALNYYPLPGSGERFPVNDSQKQNYTRPRPSSDVDFFQALLEGISDIEAEGYRKLEALGAPSASRVFTAGGGSKNPAWEKIRAQRLAATIVNAVHCEASYGSALLALRAMKNEK